MRTFLSTAAIAIGSLAILATPASAQDVVEENPFTGIYVGGAIGFDAQGNDLGSRVNFDRNLDGNYNETVTTAAGANAFGPGFCNGAALASTPDFGCENDKDNISYYGRVGFDGQIGPFIVGAMGEFGKTEIRDSVSAFSTTPAFYTLTREVEWEASARLRAGLAFDNTLFYGTGGAGYAKITNSYSSSNTMNTPTVSDDDQVLGFVVGGGLEQKLGRNFSIGLEYTYHDYKDNESSVRLSQGTAAATNPFVLAPNTTGTDLQRSDEDFRWHSVRAVAAFRF